MSWNNVFPAKALFAKEDRSYLSVGKFKHWLSYEFWSSFRFGLQIVGFFSLVTLSILDNPYRGYCQLFLSSLIGLSLIGFYVSDLWSSFYNWYQEREYQKQRALDKENKDGPSLPTLRSREEDEYEKLLNQAKTSDNPLDQLFYEVGSLEQRTGMSLSAFIIWVSFMRQPPRHMDNITFIQYLGVAHKMIELYEASSETVEEDDSTDDGTSDTTKKLLEDTLGEDQDYPRV